MRSTIHSRKARRRGQALLLAVLIMIFAALLSAAFIGIVAVNLNQTARQSDKSRSLEAANTGMKYISSQLADTADGDRWRAELESVPPAPGDRDYNFYYTPMEMSQGWARTTPHPGDLNNNGLSYPAVIDPGDERMALEAARLTGKLELVKFPDPRNQPNAPTQFLGQVERVPYTSTSDVAGALKITVIGISSEDPTAFTRLVSYKGGYKHSPIAQVMRTVSSWDFVRNSSIAAQTNPIAGKDGTAATTPVLQVTNAKGDFTKLGTPFPITLSNPRDTSVLTRTAVVVSAVQGTDKTIYDLTLATPLAASPKTGERVNLAADFGGPNGIDLDNNPTTAVTPFTTPLSLTDTTPSAPGVNEVDGARVNGSLIWSGAFAAARLRPLSSAYGSTGFVPGTIWASAVIAPDPNNDPAFKATVRDISSTNSDILQASDDSRIFESATAVQGNRNELIQDGWNSNKGVPAPSTTASNVPDRTVRDFNPPAIDSGASLARYRDLARFSLPAVTSDPTSASLYGYGQGIYINNPQDKERVYDTTVLPNRLREMNQTELTQMWLSQPLGTAVDFLRTGTPTPTTDANYANVSLEQKHLRGWVGPDEFRARGVEIQLGSNSVTITRDARTDTNYGGGDPNQTWKDRTSGADLAGTYTQTLPWPKNGVIFAEGNIRIKGTGTNVTNSLTVVSMGNIYIEDSLAADSDSDGILTTGTPRKILLLAKRNVVMNPTRLLGRPDQQTTAAGAQTLSVGPANLTVGQSAGFHIGDFIQTGVSPNVVQGYLTAEPSSPTILNLDVTSGGAVTDGSVVFTPNAPTLSATLLGKPVLYNQIGASTDVIQRRFNVPANSNFANLRLAFNHQANRIPVLKVEAVASGDVLSGNLHTPPTQAIRFSNKGVFLAPAAPPAYLNNAKTVYATADNKLSGQYFEPSPGGIDDFYGTPAVLPTTELDATAATRNIDAISAQMNAVTHEDALPVGVGWKYKTSVLNAPYGTLPFFYLAGVGSRTQYGVAGNPVDLRPNINTDLAGALTTPTGAAYEVPLATSISWKLNDVNSDFFNENWNTTLATPNYDYTNQFGIRPTYVDTATAPNSDVLTNDQGFYQLDQSKSTLDSRSAYNATTAFNGLPQGSNSLVMRQTDGLLSNPATNPLPAYWMLDAKVEDIALNVGAITAITPGHTFNVNAYVYAQTGSWFVISGPLYDDRLRGDETQSYLDINNNNTPDSGEYAKGTGNTGLGFEVGDFADLNRNGVVDAADKYAMARFSRFNYSITFTGAIAENQTPLVNDVISGSTIMAKGAVADWMNKWTTTSFDGTNVTHDRIRYIFDPTVVSGKLEDDLTTPNTDETDYGFRLPQTTDLFNVS